MPTADASNGTEGEKSYPPPDFSKTYTQVSRRQAPPKGYLSRLFSMVKAEFGIDLLEPSEKVTREELKVCLPKFDPRCDLQLGEWVLVIPHRRSELIEPLIKIVEEKGLEPKYPFLDNCYSFAASSSEALTAANDCLPDLNNKEHFVHPSRVFPSLADSYKKYSRSRKHSRSYGEHGGEVEDETMLYLNYKALILTSSAPSIFGGSDFLEGLDKETNRVVFFNWKTGEVRTDSSALQPNKVPDWAEEVVEKAEEEFSRWRRHHRDVSRVSVKKGLPVRSGLDAPPSR